MLSLGLGQGYHGMNHRDGTLVPLQLGEVITGGDLFQYTVVSTFPDGSSTLRRSDGKLSSLRGTDSVTLNRVSPARSFLP